MAEGAQNHYQVLRIERTADERAIKKAYFTLIRQFPPDTHPEEFKAIRAAYEVKEGDGPYPTLTITLKYADNRQRVISGVRRISKPGRRVYAKHDRLPKVLGGMGTAILSTPTGVITSRQAAERGIGGEVLCFVW